MDIYVIIGVLFVGGLIGWMLYFFTVLKITGNHKKEMKIVNQIQQDIEIVKQEIKKLK